MEDILSYVSPNFLVKRKHKIMWTIGICQYAIAFIILQVQGNPMIPRPLGILSEGWGIIWTEGFTDNFLTTLFFIFKGMGISMLISMVISYMFRIDILKLLPWLISKARFLSLAGIVYLLTILIHNNGHIKLWALVISIVPYFVTSLVSYFEAINPKEYQLCYTLKMNSWQTLWEVVIKGKMHLVLEVLSQNFGFAWMMIPTLEILAWSEGGLGTLLITENRHFRMERVFAILMIIQITGIFLDYLWGLIKVSFFPYTDTDRFAKLWVVQISRYLQNRRTFTADKTVAK